MNKSVLAGREEHKNSIPRRQPKGGSYIQNVRAPGSSMGTRNVTQ